MANIRLKQSVGAGTQFDGTVDKGRFEWNDQSGVNPVRIALSMGSEDKSWEIRIVHTDGEIELIESGSGDVQSVVKVGEWPISPGDRIEVHTTGATSAMDAVVIFRDEPEKTIPR